MTVPCEGHIPTRSDTKHPAETANGVVRRSPVVVHEDFAIATVCEERSAEFPNVGRSTYPTRSFHVELTELLQRSLVFFSHKLNSHFRSEAHCTVRRLVLFPGIQGFAVVTNASAAFRGFR